MALGVGSLQSVVRVCVEMVGWGLLRVHWLAYRFLAVGPALAFLLVVGSAKSQEQCLSRSLEAAVVSCDKGVECCAPDPAL